MQTCLDVLGKREFEDSDAPRREELQNRFYELMRQRPPLSSDDPRNLFESSYIFNTIVQGGGPIRVAFDAILASLLMSTWTSFESSATDLWTTAVDLTPKTLVANFISKAQSKNQEKSVFLSVLLEKDFDFTTCMGRYLKESKKAEFESLKSIQDQYVRAFGDDAAKLFDSAELRSLERVRSLFAHRGGVVDQQFLRATRDDKSGFTNLVEGKPLELDVTSVRQLIDAGVERAVGLLQFVDGWLCQNS